jgi:lipoprotein-anchoring transpeptidase ErfK/SrfK
MAITRWRRFTRRWGWRAYALPALTLVTGAALVHGIDPSSASGPDSGGDQVARAGSPVTEGFSKQDAAYQVGSTPTPVVVSLGSDVTSCASNAYRQILIVSISRQHLWACEGAKQVASTAVTTGRVVDHDQTPLGSWRVQAKERNRYLVGPGYRDYVQYWVPFNGDFGLHDASWQTMPFGSKDWRTQGSHGCVHVPTATMAWLYRWATVSDTVVTVER